jgi:hypothetical protein
MTNKQVWTSPAFEEVDMNAEIGGYQADGPPIVENNEDAAVSE